MKKSIKERFNAAKDWDFEEMVSDYGMDFLSEKDYEAFEMEMFNRVVGKNDALEAVRSCYLGSRYGCKNELFNATDDWFIYNPFPHLESIPNLDEYLKKEVNEEEFYTYCVDEGYFESEED